MLIKEIINTKYINLYINLTYELKYFYLFCKFELVGNSAKPLENAVG